MADYDGEQEQSQQDEFNEQDQGQEEQTGQGNQGESDSGGEGEQDDEVVITIGEEPPPHEEDDESELTPQAKTKFGHMRREAKERERENRELRRQLAEKSAAVPEAAPTVGEKPTLESCEYDAETFETKLTAWHERKRAVDEASAKKQREADDAMKAWSAKQDAYKVAKATIKVADFEEAEATALDVLDATQQGIILEGCKTPAAAAQLIYALGKNPEKLKQLASIKNPVQYAFAAADLVSQMKVTQKKSPPPPEKSVRGSSTVVGSNDPKLARLEAAAEKSGIYTDVINYKRELKQKAKA